MVELVPYRFQDHFRELLYRLWVSVKVYTSTSKVDTVAYRSFSLDTYRLILTGFNNDRAEEKKQWIFISPTLRALLAHGHELVQINNNRGLGDYTEQGLEHNNNFL